MKALLKTNETSVEIKDEDLLKRFPEFATGYTSLKEAIKKKETEKPTPLPQIAAVTEVTPAPPPHHILVRGNYGNPGAGGAAWCAGGVVQSEQRYQIDSDAPGRKNSARRLIFAQWLTSPNQPMLARLMVNRIWQHHFGVGLVATSDNFGVTGAKPSHPELLDYLATEFVGSGWSVKAMHRLIVNSATYRQSSALREACFKIDPENRLLWRYSLQRLDAESVRDAMLFTTGELDGKLGGPYVPTKRTSEGQVVVEEANPGANAPIALSATAAHSAARSAGRVRCAAATAQLHTAQSFHGFAAIARLVELRLRAGPQPGLCPAPGPGSRSGSSEAA